jgi:hypothetical protein
MSGGGRKMKEMSEVNAERKIINFSELRARDPFGTGTIIRIDEVLNTPIIIEDFKIDKGQLRGKDVSFVYILATLEDGRKVTIRTTSSVVARQLEQVQKLLEQGYVIRATPKKTKNYIQLT